MDDVEYILRLVLKARDDMAAVLAKARTQIRGFASDADKMNTSVTKLNGVMDKFNTNMDGVTKKLEAWRAVLRDAGGDGDKTSKSIDGITKSIEKNIRVSQQSLQTQKQLQDRARALRDEVKGITAAREKEAISTKFAAAEYERLGKQLEAVSLKMSDAARKKTPADIWAIGAREAADNIKQIDNEITNDAKAERTKREAIAKEAERIRLAGVKSHNQAISREIEQQIRKEQQAQVDHQRFLADLEKRRVAMVKLGNAQVAREIEQQIRVEEQAARESERTLERRKKLIEDEISLRHRAADVQRNISRAQAGGAGIDPADIAELRELTNGYRRLSREQGISRDRAREYGREAENLSAIHRRSTQDTDQHSNALSKLAGSFSNAGSSAAGFDNQMRGIGILAAVASINELISVAISLGGELVSLASSAVMAGGALGGALAAGASQALPVLGLLAGAVQRVTGGIMDAFTAQQNLSKAQFTDAEKGGQKALDKTNQLANANDTLAAANDRLADSRKSLTVAQADGVRQLEDLIFAEKAAALAAKGAALNVKDAQTALREAIASGAGGAEVAQRQQAVDEARLSASRAGTTARRATQDRRAAGGDVGNLDSVKNAAKAVDDAEKAVTRANRGLDLAVDKTDRAASSTMTAAANLDFLLSQLSPAERKLYESIQRIYDNYKRIFAGEGTGGSGIYGVIIDSFTRAVDKADEIMQMPKVIDGVQHLANVIGQNLDKIVNAVDPEVIGQLLTIMEHAGENMGPLVDGAIKLAKAFLGIQEDANPAFVKLIEYLGGVVDKIVDLTDDSKGMTQFFLDGEESLEAWLDLLLAIIDLFATLVGASADEGTKSIEDLTEKIKGWTDWLDDHHDDVVGFFEDAREAAYKIGGVLENLAVTLFKTFDPDRVDDLATIFNDVLIPALDDIMTAIGTVSDAVATFVSNPVGAEIAKWAVSFLLLWKVAQPIAGVLVNIVKGADKFVGFLERVLPKLSKVMPFLSRMSALRFVAFGTGFLAIAAAVVFLLDKLGLLDDLWEEIKEAGAALWEQIEPPVKRFMESFQRLIDAVQKGDGAFGPLIDALRIFMKILIEVGGFVLESVARSIGKVIGGIIDVISGFIDIITGLLTGDFGLVWDGVKKIVVGALRAIIGFFELIFFRGLGRVIGLGFKGIRLLFTRGGEAMLDGLKGFGKTILNLFKDAFDAVWGFLKTLPGKWWDLAKDIVTSFWRGYRRIGRILRDAIEDAWGWLKRLPGRFWDLAKSIAQRFWDGYKAIGRFIRKGIEDVWGWLKGLPKRLGDIAVDAAKAFGNAFKDVGKLIIDSIGGGVGKAGAFAKGIANGVFNLINQGWNNFIGGKEIGIGPAKFKIPELHIKMARGGKVPGAGDGDTVPAMLTPGEHVLTKAEVAAAGGHGVIFALRAMLGGGSQGGPFGYALGGTAYIAPGISPARTGMGDINEPDYKAANKRAADARKADADDRKKALATEREDYKRSGNQRAEDNRTMWNDILTTTRRAANDVEEQIRDMRVNTTKTFARLVRDIPAAWSAMWFSLMKVTNQGLTYIGHETNKALAAMGEDHINFGLTAPRAPSSGNEGGATTSTDHTQGGRFAMGGFVNQQGMRGRDRGAYALGDGEAVLGWMHQPYVEAALNAQYGFGLGGLFNRVRGYHAGGPGQSGLATGGFPNFGGHPQNVIPGIKRLIELLQRKFPLLQVTSTTDHSLMTTSGNVSDHSVGHAVDLSATIPYMARVTQFINSSGLWKQLKQGIHNPGLAVNRGERVDGPAFFTGAWPQHIDHIHLALLGALGHVAGAITGIGRKIVTPRGTATARLVQAAIDKVRRIANRKITESGSGGDTESYGAGGNMTANMEIGKRMAADLYNWTGSQWTALKALWTGESNWDEKAYNSSSGATGIPQALPGNKMASEGPDWKTNAATQIKWGLKYIKDRPDYGDPATAYRLWQSRSPHWYARGGEINGPDGSPVGIIAHAGEWILNKGQQLRAAMMAGLSVPGLRSMLGFHGGPGGAAGGTEVRDKRGVPLVTPITTIKTLGDDLDDTWKGLTEIAREIKKIKRKTDKGDAKKIEDSYTAMIDLIDNITGPLGIGAIADEVTARVNRAATRLKRDIFKVGPGGRIAKVMDDGGILDRELASMGRYMNDLMGEKGGIIQSLNKTNKKIKDIANDKTLSEGTRRKLIQRLESDRNDLLTNLDRVNGEIADANETQYNKQVEIDEWLADQIQKRVDEFQKGVDAIKAAFTRRTAANDLVRRVATALGNADMMESVNNEAAAIITDNINALITQIHKAGTLGYNDQQAELQAELEDLYVQMTELAVQRLRDLSDAISTAASRERTKLDLFGRMADALGVVGQVAAAAIPGLGEMTRAGVAQGRVRVGEDERARLTGVRDQARAQGNIVLDQELTDKINELTVQIAENTKAAFDARIAAVGTAHDYDQSMLDLRMQLLDLDTTITGANNTAQKQAYLVQKGNDLLAKGNELTDLLHEATPGTQTYKDLEKAILENEIATKQNTVALNEVIGASTAPSSFVSTPWEWMHIPLLTGTGNLNPQYMVPGTSNLGFPGGSSTSGSSTVNGGTTINTEVTVNEAGQPIDATKIANAVVFSQSTAF
jgi:hypothetical protein